MFLNKKKLLRLALLISITVYACTQNNSTETALEPAMPQADTPLSQYSVDAQTGALIPLPNGTTLNIPQNAFVDEDGNPITGVVDIAYREFHNAGSILASGIPMEYNYNGEKGHFVTAGMFEIRGYTQGNAQMQLLGSSETRKEVYIADGKAITNQMASFANDDEDDSYRFYFFNEATKQWEPKGESTAIPNQKKLDALNAEAPVPKKPLAPTSFDKSLPVIDLNANTSQFPELKAFKGLLWQYAGEDEEQDPHAPQNIERLAKTEWDNIDLQPTKKPGVYKAVFSSSTSNSRFETELKPVLRGKNYEKALSKFEKKLDKFQEARQKRMVAEEQRKLEGNFIREAKINQFGIYNHDKLWASPDMISCKASFQTSEGELSTETVYMLTETDKGLVRYDSKDWAIMQYVLYDAVFVAILDNDRIGVISRAEVEALGVPKGGEQTFTLRIEEGIDSPQNLSASIAKLW